MKYYSGIGSRETPTEIQHCMVDAASILAIKGYTLRSGGAQGADLAFEHGCGGGPKEIFIPWERFQASNSPLFPPTPEAIKLSKSVHPVYNKLTPNAKLLIARNMHQILGQDLDTPVDFVICYTEDGCECEEDYSIKTGGTGSAIVLASRNNIPIYNLANDSSFSYVFNILLSL